MATTGVFGISRNPIYLGLVLAIAGIGLAANFVVWIVGAIAGAIAMR